MEHETPTSVRVRLIVAGKSLFARLGYEGTSTATIAREAGTSESQLVRYFASKSGLLEAIFNEAWNALNEPIQAMVSSAEHERAAIARILRLIIDAFGRDHELGFIFLFEGRRIRGHEVALSKGFLTFYEMIHQLIRQGQEHGSFRRDISADVLASALLGCAEGMLRDRMIGERTGKPIQATNTDIEKAFAAIIDALA
jgi:TetR/AcrR family transcriptional regulator, transcriptional repressor for nem operon